MLEINNACCFFGHRDAPEYIIPEIKSNIETLITEYGVTTFYIGNQGRFDSMVVSVLKEMKNKYSQISYSVVLAYLPKENENYNEKKHPLSIWNRECTETLLYIVEKQLDDR